MKGATITKLIIKSLLFATALIIGILMLTSVIAPIFNYDTGVDALMSTLMLFVLASLPSSIQVFLYLFDQARHKVFNDLNYKPRELKKAPEWTAQNLPNGVYPDKLTNSSTGVTYIRQPNGNYVSEADIDAQNNQMVANGVGAIVSILMKVLVVFVIVVVTMFVSPLSCIIGIVHELVALRK